MFREPRLFEVHDVLAAARRGTDEDQTPKDRGTVEHHLLGDHAAERESEDIARSHAESVEERDDMLRHAGDGCRHGARRAAHAGVVEQNEFPLGGEGVCQRGIPVIERSGEVLEEQ